MEHIVTSQFIIKELLTIKQVLKLNLFAKEFKGVATIQSRGNTVNIKDLPTLMSFFLTTTDDELQVRVEGEDAEFAYATIQVILSGEQKIGLQSEHLLL